MKTKMGSPILESHSDQSKNPPKFYGFHTFAEPGCPITPTGGAFRDNVRRFLQECAYPEDYDLDGMLIWRTFLVYERTGTVLPLYTVEENVDPSDRPLCDYCHCVGWSHHFVSKRKYHFIIPANNEWNHPIDEDFFDQQTHLLHGVIHCNGFGHLICINGIEGGSEFIYGREIMDLWDRICTSLCARKIAVEDLSKKRKMDLRLLYGVAYGHTWFGKWGYRFFHGGFGHHHYEAAIGFLSSLVLDEVVEDFSLVEDTCIDIKQIVHHYRQMSGTNLVTVGDLFRFMLTPKSTSRSLTRKGYTICTPKRWSLKFPSRPAFKSIKEKPTTKCRKFSKMDSRWPGRRLEHVADVIVQTLKLKRGEKMIRCRVMTRQEGCDAARLHIDDTVLIDHFPKAMNNVKVGNHIAGHAVNRSSKALEYTTQDFKGDKQVCRSKVKDPSGKYRSCSARNLYDDVINLYRNVLLTYPNSESVESAAQVILHSKHFVKEFPSRYEYGDSLKFFCRLYLSFIDDKDDVSFDFMPVEYVDVPLYATVGDLKIAVRNAFCDTYCELEKLQVTEILELEGVEDDEVLIGIVESGMELRVKGTGIDLEDSLRHEGGTENWTVKCKCGARDVDGERMLACDICETWQHTHCCGIGEDEAVPRLFVCETCCSSLVTVPRPCGLTYYNYNSCEGSSFAADSWA